MHSETLPICIFEYEVDSGLSRAAQCKLFSESKMGIKYWLLPPHFSHLLHNYNLIEINRGYFDNKLNSGLEANCEKG